MYNYYISLFEDKKGLKNFAEKFIIRFFVQK
jgi:hypothetical protein